MAWAIIPRPWVIDIGIIHLPAWRIFLIICTIPSIISAITFYFQHESPKFLMTQGRNDEAMAAFRSIYATNFGNPKSSFPVEFNKKLEFETDRFLKVRSLKEEKQQTNTEKVDEEPKSATRFLKLGWLQTKPLFLWPHLPHALLVFLFQAGSLFG